MLVYWYEKPRPYYSWGEVRPIYSNVKCCSPIAAPGILILHMYCIIWRFLPFNITAKSLMVHMKTFRWPFYYDFYPVMWPHLTPWEPQIEFISALLDGACILMWLSMVLLFFRKRLIFSPVIFPYKISFPYHSFTVPLRPWFKHA